MMLMLMLVLMLSMLRVDRLRVLFLTFPSDALVVMW